MHWLLFTKGISMRNPPKPLLPALFSLLCLLSVSAADLKTYSDVYVKKYAEYETDLTARLDALTANYGQAPGTAHDA